MKHRLCTLLFMMSLVFVTETVYAQKQGMEKIDSLLVELGKVKADTVQIKILSDIAWEYALIAEYEQALSYAEKAVKQAENSNRKNSLIYSYDKLSGIYFYMGNYNNALKYYEQALKIIEELNDKIYLRDGYHKIASIYLSQNRVSEALDYFLRALKEFEQSDNKDRVAAINDDIGWLYFIMNEYEKALQYLSVSEKLNEEIGDKVSIAYNHNSFGAVYTEMKKYDFALIHFVKAFEIYNESDDKINMCVAISNIGVIYQHKKDYISALQNFSEALKLAESIKNDIRIIDAEYRLGGVNTKLNRFDEAEKWLKSSMQRSKELGDNNSIMNNYAALVDLYRYKGSYKEAYEYYELYTTYKDSIFNEDNTRELTRLEMNYEFEKQQEVSRLENEKEIAIRDAMLEANRKQKYFYVAGIFGLAFIGGLLYYQSRMRKKKNEKLRLLNAELDQANRIKTRFFSILNHDLRSPVSNLIHYLHLKKESPELLDEETKQRLDQKSIQGAENLLITMEDLLLWSKGQMENFKPQPKIVAVHQLFEDTKKVFSGYQNIRFEYHNPDKLEIYTDENYLKTIIRNLTSNAINVFTTTPHPHIVWKAYVESGKPMLTITDNGPGADNEKFSALYDDTEVIGIKSGLGLHLIRDLAKVIQCRIEVDTRLGIGTKISLLL